jgi:hypothetical protein
MKLVGGSRTRHAREPMSENAVAVMRAGRLTENNVGSQQRSIRISGSQNLLSFQRTDAPTKFQLLAYPFGWQSWFHLVSKQYVQFGTKCVVSIVLELKISISFSPYYTVLNSTRFL